MSLRTRRLVVRLGGYFFALTLCLRKEARLPSGITEQQHAAKRRVCPKRCDLDAASPRIAKQFLRTLCIAGLMIIHLKKPLEPERPTANFSRLAKVPIGRAVLDYRWISDNCEHALARTKNCAHDTTSHATFFIFSTWKFQKQELLSR